MARTAEGSCTRPHKRRGGPKQEGGSKKHSHADRHKKRKKKEDDIARGIEEGRNFVGATPSCCVLKKLGTLDDEKKATECLKGEGALDTPNTCHRCGEPCRPEFNRNRTRCNKVNCQFAPPKNCEMCNGPMLKPHPDENPAECARHCADQDECGWTWNPGQAFLHSFFKGALFCNSGLEANRVVFLLWLWLMRIPSSRAATMIGVRPQTAGGCCRLLRQITVEMLLHQGCYDSQVGGGGTVVETDESKFGKRKHDRGRRVKGDWVLGMAERTKERRMVLVVAPNRTAETLEAAIDGFIAPGSIMHSDVWKGHDELAEMEGKKFDHRRLCHKCEFVSKDGIHTQTIEGNWTAVKRTAPVCMRSSHDLQEFLFEFVWRRQHASDLWEAMMDGLSGVRFTAKMLNGEQAKRDERCEDEDDGWELPRSARPRDVKFECDSDVDGDDEVMATGALSSMMVAEMEAERKERHRRGASTSDEGRSAVI